jgi:predicted nuclease with RNAse H fold
MHYCGAVPMRGRLQLAMLEEVRTPEPPIRLSAIFFEPGSAEQVAAELRSLEDVVVALGAPLSEPRQGRQTRSVDDFLRRLGVSPQPHDPEAGKLADQLRDLPRFTPRDGRDDHDGAVGEGSYNEFPLFETNADAVFCALQGRRLPAKRHPFGIQLRIDELSGDHVIDEGGDLWHRRIEEIDAAACALAAHRYAVGHASWLGEADEAVVVLPGSSIPAEFDTRGVMPPVERLQLRATRGQL